MGDHEGRPYDFMWSFAVGANLVFALCQHHTFFNTLGCGAFAAPLGLPYNGAIVVALHGGWLMSQTRGSD